jgi:hypothetical protein
MASAEKAILTVRAIHIAFVTTIFLFVLVCRISAPTEHPVSHATVAAFGFANITSFAQAETVALFGVALKFLGVSWAMAGGFFVVGLALMMLWTPRVPVWVNAPG